MVGANDLQESKKFYDTTLGALGHDAGVITQEGPCFYLTASGVFAITKPIDDKPACHGNGSTIGFLAKTPEIVDTWHEIGLANGGSLCEEPPGIRSVSIGKLYLAYLRDPSGNKICAMHRISYFYFL